MAFDIKKDIPHNTIQHNTWIGTHTKEQGTHTEVQGTNVFSREK